MGFFNPVMGGKGNNTPKSCAWIKQGMSEEITCLTQSITVVFEKTEKIEYSSISPTYNEEKRQWEFQNSTIIDLSTSPTSFPSTSVMVYARSLASPQIWYYSPTITLGSSNYTLTASKKYEASVDEIVKNYILDEECEKYPNKAWQEGYWYERVTPRFSQLQLENNSGEWVYNKDEYSDQVIGIGLDSTYPSLAFRQNDVYSDGVTVGIFKNNGMTGIYYSTDNDYFQDGAWYPTNVQSGNFLAIGADKRSFVAIEEGKGPIYSQDGQHWEACFVMYGSQNFPNTGKISLVSGYCSSYPDISQWLIGCDQEGKGLYYSRDGGYSWTTAGLTDAGAIRQIVYGNYIWLVSTDTGVYYCNDKSYPRSWTLISTFSNKARSICYGNGVFVAAQDSANVYYSTNGTSWSTATVGGAKVNYVCYVGQCFFAATSNKGLYYSTNGTSWTQTTTFTSDTYHISQLSDGIANYSTYYYLNVGGRLWSCSSSTAPKSWTEVYTYNTSLTTGLPIYNCSYTTYFYTDNGIRWFTGNNTRSSKIYELTYKQSQVVRGKYPFDRIKYCKDRFLLSGYKAGLWYSFDGIHLYPTNILTNDICDFLYSYEKDLFIATGGNISGGIYYSQDGEYWYLVPGFEGSYDRGSEKVDFVNGVFVAAAQWFGVAYSLDGKNWNYPLNNITEQVRCVKGDKNIWIAGTDTSLYYSIDNGKQWNKVSNVSDFINCIIIANDKFYAHGDTNIWISDDGITWTCLSSQGIPGTVGGKLLDISDNIMVLGCGNSSTNPGLWYSQDNGNTWIQSNISTGYFNCIKHNGTLWFASGGNGIYRSTDGKNWEQTNITSSTHQLAYGNNVWIAALDDKEGLGTHVYLFDEK